MRIKESQLRRIIREELGGARGDSAIVVLGNTSVGPVYVLAYEIEKLESNLQNPGDELSQNGVVAGLTLKKSGEYGECNGSWQVVASASDEKGWGTRVYLAALDFLRNISSDRFSVTPAAEGMWKRLARYGFVEREEFDNIKNPKTPPTSDDCRVFPARDPVINSSWRITGEIPSDVKGLVDAGDSHLRRLDFFLNRREAEDLLRNGFNQLFIRKYSGD